MGTAIRSSFSPYRGSAIETYTLRNNSGTEAEIMSYGAIIKAFRFRQKNGSVNDIVLGFDRPEDYVSESYQGLEAYPYFGAIIGRYANRIASGKFSLDGKQYQLAPNLPPEHLHGGIEGFDRKNWTLLSLVQEPHAQVTLEYSSPDGEEGYPGALTLQIQYQLNDDNELSILYTADAGAPTILNPTNHSYFNLNNGKGLIDRHVLRIPSPATLEQDAHSTPTGNLVRVEDTLYDFRTDKRIGLDWDEAKGYDQSFVIDGNITQVAAEVRSDESGLKLEVFTTFPVVHLYTGSGIKDIGGKALELYRPFSGFSLECHVHPNAINLPNFPDTILRPGEKYREETIYKVSELS